MDHRLKHKKKIRKALRQSIVEYHQDLRISKGFLQRTWTAIAIKDNIDEGEIVEMIHFCSSKDTVRKTNQPADNERKYL